MSCPFRPTHVARQLTRTCGYFATFRLAGLAVFAASVAIAQAQTPGGGSSRSVVRLDPALDDVLSPGARLEVLKSDYFGISEGPVWIQQRRTGYLLFSDIGANVVYK